MSDKAKSLGFVAVASFLLYNAWSFHQDWVAKRNDAEKRSHYKNNFTPADAYFVGEPQTDGSILVKLQDVDGKHIANVAVFSDSLEKAKKHQIDKRYIFFVRERQTYGINLPLYEKYDNYVIGDFYALGILPRHNGGLYLPSWVPDGSKVYCDCKSFAVALLPENH